MRMPSWRQGIEGCREGRCESRQVPSSAGSPSGGESGLQMGRSVDRLDGEVAGLGSTSTLPSAVLVRGEDQLGRRLRNTASCCCRLHRLPPSSSLSRSSVRPSTFLFPLGPSCLLRAPGCCVIAEL